MTSTERSRTTALLFFTAALLVQGILNFIMYDRIKTIEGVNNHQTALFDAVTENLVLQGELNETISQTLGVHTDILSGLMTRTPIETDNEQWYSTPSVEVPDSLDTLVLSIVDNPPDLPLGTECRLSWKADN